MLLFFRLPALPSGSGDVPGERARRVGTSRLLLQITKRLPKDGKPLPKSVILKQAGSRAFEDFWHVFMGRTALPRSWFSRSNKFVRSSREMGSRVRGGPQGCGGSITLVRQREAYFCLCHQTVTPTLEEVSISGFLHPSPVWGTCLGRDASCGHIPGRCSGWPCCARGVPLQPRWGAEQGRGCGDGVEQHSRRACRLLLL